MPDPMHALRKAKMIGKVGGIMNADIPLYPQKPETKKPSDKRLGDIDLDKGPRQAENDRVAEDVDRMAHSFGPKTYRNWNQARAKEAKRRASAGRSAGGKR